MFFVHLRDLSFIWPFREANTRSVQNTAYLVVIVVDKNAYSSITHVGTPKEVKELIKLQI